MDRLCKIMVADDEPMIRRGIKNSFDWETIGFEFVGEAEDGEEALQLALDREPDVLLVDINMPFVNGLEFVERLLRDRPRALVIIITGYDEFAYAQQALKLGVFDYLLKPVTDEQFYEVLMKAKDQLAAMDAKMKYDGWAHQQLNRNLAFLRQRFLEEWLQGRLSEEEIGEQIAFLNMQLEETTGVIVLHKREAIMTVSRSADWNRDLMCFAIQNVVEDLLGGAGQVYSCRDSKDYLVFLCRIGSRSEWKEMPESIAETVHTFLKMSVSVTALTVEKDAIIVKLPQLYAEAVEELSKESGAMPIVMLAKAYIEARYGQEDLSLKEVAEGVNISPSYLSRLLRQELGLTFNDYLTQTRVKHAAWFLQDPTMKIYEVASRVGYSTQHYFSTAFKRVLGVSPIEYRNGAKK